MSNARKLADNLPTEGSLSERNLVINGNMTIAQRSSSVSSQTGSGYKTVDRIYTNASGSTYNQSQQTVTVGGETGLPTQFTKFLRHDVTTSNDNAHFYHKIEGVASVPAGTVTLSFYAKGTTPTGGVAFRAYQNFGTGGSPSGEVSITISDTVTLTSTWQRFSINITVPSITGKTLGTNGNDTFYFGIGQFANTSTSAYQLDITGLQLEVGPQSTPFEHEPYDTTLEKCQRYFQVSGLHSDGRTYGIVFSQFTNVNAYSNQRWWKIMRAAPTITMNTVGNYNIYNTGAARGKSVVGIGQLSDNSGEFYITTDSLTQGTATHLNTNGDTFCWKADAEL